MPSAFDPDSFFSTSPAVTIMGLGRFGGGAGAARFFARRGARVTVTDMAGRDKLADSLASLADLPISCHLGGHSLEDFVDADLVLANQAVRPDNHFLAAARERGVPVLTETGLALRLNKAPWLAVSGSSGKSTTASLIAAALSSYDQRTLFGGNIGGDLLARIEARPGDAPVVVELSSFQLIHMGPQLACGEIAPPQVAALTNITPNHLDWHRDFDEYRESKLNILRCQKAGSWAVLNRDDPVLSALPALSPARIVSCALRDPETDDACYVADKRIVLRLGGSEAFVFDLAGLRLLGRHNVMNAVEAVAAAFVFCRDSAAVTAGIAGFAGLPHRLQTVAVIDGKTFVNDSKSTTPEAAILAMAALEQPKVLIAGGYDKQSPFEKLGQAIQREAAALVLVGATAGRLRQAVEAAAGQRRPGDKALAIVQCGGDFRQAVETAFALCPPQGVVLLSPACASWDMFNDFEERGRLFVEIVEGLGGRCLPS